VSSVHEEPYAILLRGPWPRERVIVREAPPFHVPPEQEALVERAWQAALALAARSGRRLFPGPVLGLASARVAADRLEVALQATDYRAFVATNLSAEYRATGAPCADALGVSVLIELGSGFLLHRRGAGCFEEPLAVDTPGGHIEPGATPFEAALSELESELGVVPGDIASIELLGLCRLTETRKPQAVLRARAERSLEEIRSRLEGARERFETSELLPVARGALAALGERERLTPACRAAIALARS